MRRAMFQLALLLATALVAAPPRAALADGPPAAPGVATAASSLPAAAPAAAPARHVIVVFGTSVRPDGSPTPMLEHRLEVARALAERDPGARVVVSGGAVHTAYNEARGMAEWLAGHGVDSRRIDLEPRARNTAENADFVVAMLRGAPPAQVTLVTSRFHMDRSVMHLRAALRTAGLGALRVARAPAPDGLRGLARVRTTLREMRSTARDIGFRLRAGTLGLVPRARPPAAPPRLGPAGARSGGGFGR